MGTILATLIIIYCIVAVFTMIEKKSHAKPPPEKKGPDQDDNTWIDSYEDGHKWLNFASGLSDTPSSEIPCRPLDK
jgi:hypothetical protein